MSSSIINAKINSRSATNIPSQFITKVLSKALPKAMLLGMLSASLSGCIFEEQGIFAKDKNKQDSKDKAVEVVSFGFNQSSNTQVGDGQINYIERADIKISRDNTQITEKALFGKDNSRQDNDTTHYLLAKGVSIETTDNYRKAAQVTIDDKLAYHLIWKDKETANTLREDIEYLPIDLTGQSGVTDDKSNQPKKGLMTILNRLPATKVTSFAFPEGSTCYVTRTKIDKDHVQFSSKDDSPYKSLTDWRGDQSFKSEIAELSLGRNNEVAVSYISNAPQAKRSDRVKSYRGAVQLKDKVYEAKIIPAQDWSQDSNPMTALVECQAYNKVAADFIESEIKRVY